MPPDRMLAPPAVLRTAGLTRLAPAIPLGDRAGALVRALPMCVTIPGEAKVTRGAVCAACAGCACDAAPGTTVATVSCLLNAAMSSAFT